jgi:hypothetical protein
VEWTERVTVHGGLRVAVRPSIADQLRLNRRAVSQHQVALSGTFGICDLTFNPLVADVPFPKAVMEQLEPMLEWCEKINGKRPDRALADADYWSEANAQLEDGQTELFIATTKDWKRWKDLR